jgi:hypothetical protein
MYIKNHSPIQFWKSVNSKKELSLKSELGMYCVSSRECKGNVKGMYSVSTRECKGAGDMNQYSEKSLGMF